MQKFPSRLRNVTQKDKFLFITTNLSDVCLSICRFRRVITHRHANHFGQTSYPSNTLILVLLLTLPHLATPSSAVELSSLATHSFSSPLLFQHRCRPIFLFLPFVTPVSFPVPATLSTEPAFESFHFFPEHF